MMKKYFYTFLFLCGLGLSTAVAQNRVYVNEYLNIGVGGRGLAMGNSLASLTDDVHATYYNVAGLSKIKTDLQIAAMHSEYFSGNAKYDFAALAVPFKDKKRALALSFLRFATDDIPYTIDFINSDGSFNYDKLKSISAGDYGFNLGYGQELGWFKNPHIKSSLGVNAKVLYRHIGKMAEAYGIGLDIGFLFEYKKFGLGVMAKDISTTYTTWSFNFTDREKEIFTQTGNTIPVKSYEMMYPRFNVGLHYRLLNDSSKLQIVPTIGFDVTTDLTRNTLVKVGDVSFDPRAGLEISYNNMLFLRGGVANFQKVKDDADSTNQANYTIFQPSIGVGVKLNAVSIDYAFTSLQTQSNPLMSHVISLRLDMEFIKRGASKNTDNTIETSQND